MRFFIVVVLLTEPAQALNTYVQGGNAMMWLPAALITCLAEGI